MDFTVKDILISEDHPCFAGHFPGHPILPAVAQIDLVLDLLERHFKKSLTLVAIHKTKFPAPIVPGARVAVSLHIQDRTVSWRILGPDITYATGTLQLSVDHLPPPQ